jgi:hypothetical protein
MSVLDESWEAPLHCMFVAEEKYARRLFSCWLYEVTVPQLDSVQSVKQAFNFTPRKLVVGSLHEYSPKNETEATKFN